MTDFCKSLASNILLQAYKDYRALLRGTLKPTKEVNIKELDEFLKSKWCRNLCDIVDISSDTYIEQIIQMMNDAENKLSV